MTEETAPESFLMPSRLRIMQRLGQVSMNNSLREHLFPSIAGFEREQMTAEGLVDMLTDQITSYADEHALGVFVPLMERVPQLINALVESDEVKNKSLLYYHETIMDRRAEADKGEILAMYRRRDLPRKMKKRQRSNRVKGLH